MSNYNLRILLETVEGVKTSYLGVSGSIGVKGNPGPATASFVDTSVNLVLSSSQVYHRITGSVSCSYQNSTFFSSSVPLSSNDINANFTFKDNNILSASLSGSANFGIINFESKTDVYDRLLRYKFIGEKVCQTLGLSHNQWIYTDQSRFTTDDDVNYFEGNVYAKSLSVRDNLDFSPTSNIVSHVTFLQDTGSDRYIRFIDDRASAGAQAQGLFMGYNQSLNKYEIGSDLINTTAYSNPGLHLMGVSSISGTLPTIAGGNSVINIGAANVDIFGQEGVNFSLHHKQDISMRFEFKLEATGDGEIKLTENNRDLKIRTNGFNNAIYIDDSEERVGIGTNSPDEVLHVAGNLKVNGEIQATSITSSRVTSSVVYASGSNIFGDDVTDTHTFTGNVTASNNISASGDLTVDQIIFTQPTRTGGSAKGDIIFQHPLHISSSKISAIQWDFPNDDAYIYAHQSSSDITNFVFEQRDNTTGDKFTFWFNDYRGSGSDSFPLEMRGDRFVVNNIYDRAVTYHKDSHNQINMKSNNVDFYLLKSGSSAASKANSLIFGDVSEAEVTMNGALEVTGNISSSATSTGSFGHIQIPDNGHIVLGADPDLQIYHDGSNSYIEDSGTGQLRLIANQVIIKNAADNENIIRGSQNGSVELFHNNSKKLETFASGIGVIGNITASGDITASGNISASGNMFAKSIFFGPSVAGSQNYVAVSSDDLFIGADDDLILQPDDDLVIQAGATTKHTFFAEGRARFNSTNTTAPDATLEIQGDLELKNQGHITASGNISASGKIIGDDFEFNLPSTNERKFRGLGLAGVRLHDSSGGWAMEYGFQGNDERDLGGFGAFGGADMEYFYVGRHYTKPAMTIQSGSTTRVGIGMYNGNTPPAELTVEGKTSSSRFNATGTATADGPGGVGGFRFRDRDDTGIYERNFSIGLMAPEYAVVVIDSNNNNTVSDGSPPSFCIIHDTGSLGHNPPESHKLFEVKENGITTFQTASNIGVTINNLVGHITASGNISASATSTGSFGRVEAITTLTAEHLVSTDDAFINDLLTIDGDLRFGSGQDHEIGITQPGGNSDGKILRISASNANIATSGDFDGGNVEIIGGGKVGSGVDGDVILAGGRGNVGIGTYNPTKALQVTGDISSSGDILNAGNLTISSSLDITLDADGGDVKMEDRSVGITAFQFKLDASPTIQAGGPLDIKTTGTITIDASTDIELNADGGNVTFADGSGGTKVDINTTAGHITASGDISSSGMITALGYNNISSSQGITSPAHFFQNDTGDDFMLYHKATDAIAIQSQDININGANGVGIGTGLATNSDSKLHVFGDMKVNSHITASGNISGSVTSDLQHGGTTIHHIHTFGNGDDTPDVSGGTVFKTNGTNPAIGGNTHEITTFTGGTAGQIIYVLIEDAFTTFTNGTNLQLFRGIDATSLTTLDIISFICVDGTVWRELNRQDNS